MSLLSKAAFIAAVNSAWIGAGRTTPLLVDGSGDSVTVDLTNSVATDNGALILLAYCDMSAFSASFVSGGTAIMGNLNPQNFVGRANSSTGSMRGIFVCRNIIEVQQAFNYCLLLNTTVVRLVMMDVQHDGGASHRSVAQQLLTAMSLHSGSEYDELVIYGEENVAYFDATSELILPTPVQPEEDSERDFSGSELMLRRFGVIKKEPVPPSYVGVVEVIQDFDDSETFVNAPRIGYNEEFMFDMFYLTNNTNLTPSMSIPNLFGTGSFVYSPNSIANTPINLSI